MSIGLFITFLAFPRCDLDLRFQYRLFDGGYAMTIHTNTNDTQDEHFQNESGHGGAAHGSVKEYVIGLILSIVLTAIPFGMVMAGNSGALTLAIILVCLIAQVFVQLVFFLHMNGSSKQFWNTTSGVFIVLIVLVVVLGSIWIMNHLNHNMLLGH